MNNKVFLKTLFALSLPIALQNLLHSALGMLDTLMIGQLNEVAISAVAIGNQLVFLLILLMFGITSGAGIFTSQYWGKKDLKSIHSFQGIALFLGLGASLLFFAAAQLFPAQILGIYSKDPAVITEGIVYIKIVSYTFPITAIYFAYTMVLRSTGNAAIPLLTTAIGLSLNTVLNFLLIFGKAGFPELGVQGAAIATLIARILEGSLVVSLPYFLKLPAAAPLKELVSISRKQLGRFFRRSAPVILNEIGWSVGTTMYMIIYARMGTDVVAAFAIAETVSRLAFVLFIGTANGSAIVLGNMLGRGEKDQAKLFAKKILKLSPIVAIVLGTVLASLAGFIPKIYNVSPNVRNLATWTLQVFAFILPFKTINLHVIVGVLRSGGDTIFSLLLDTMFLWFLGVPLAALMGLKLGFILPIVYTAVGIEEFAKSIFGIWRTATGKWINTLTEDSPS